MKYNIFNCEEPQEKFKWRLMTQSEFRQHCNTAFEKYSKGYHVIKHYTYIHSPKLNEND